jgi:hypothetical protein
MIMAHLWMPDEGGDWNVLSLNGADVDLTALLSGEKPRPENGAEAAPRALLLREPSAGSSGWLLVTTKGCRARVSGMSVATGIRRLSDRDEILLHGLGRCYFSTETLARIEPLSEEAATGCCPRCKQGMTVGQPAVRCPGCGVWHHQSNELPCWTYAERCAICGGSTALDAGFSWTPEEL